MSLCLVIGSGCDYLCRSPNRAKRMECVQLAAAFAALRPIQTFGHSRKRQQAARTPYASRGSVTDRNNRARVLPGILSFAGLVLTLPFGFYVFARTNPKAD